MKVLLCVSGSIAAYKSADVVSQLVKAGHEVQVLLTESAKQFVTPLVLETLSRKPVQHALWGEGISGTEHIRLARWPDVVVFAPATAHLLAKLALGLADDLVTTVALATQAPWLVAPAMNTVMWEQAIVQSHCAALKGRGATFIDPQAEGVLACGEEGAGRLATPETIVARILEFDRIAPAGNPGEGASPLLNNRAAHPLTDWTGQTLLITAGPTTSRIDAVRYLTNPSTGKMGAALAEQALLRGARVVHVLGIDKGVVRPVAPIGTEHRLTLIEVDTAEAMLDAALKYLPQATGVAATAAVLDYRFEKPANSSKEKRARDPITVTLVPSVDVLSGLKNAARPDQWFLGFAAETDDVENYGLGKLKNKGLDFLFANAVAKAGESIATGFGTSTNAGTLFFRNGESTRFSLTSKSDLAGKILDQLMSQWLVPTKTQARGNGNP